MIIVPQSAFNMIPDSPEREMAYIREKIEEKMSILDKMKEDGENSLLIKQAEREIDKLEEDIAKIAKEREDTTDDKNVQ